MPTYTHTHTQDEKGRRINVTSKWLSGGFGIERTSCTLKPSWNAWSCPGKRTYRMLVIENMDEDHEIRRISPVALSSSTGYTDLLNG